MDKYYTPKIEEFYIGFEYECILPQWAEQEWKSTKVGTNEDLDGINEIIKLNKCRVRYLSKFDMEELGFDVEDRTDPLSGYYFYLGTLKTDHDIAYTINEFDKEVKIYKGSVVDYKRNLNIGKLIFDGIIKNKSELARLLVQLKIRNND